MSARSTQRPSIRKCQPSSRVIVASAVPLISAARSRTHWKTPARRWALELAARDRAVRRVDGLPHRHRQRLAGPAGALAGGGERRGDRGRRARVVAEHVEHQRQVDPARRGVVLDAHDREQRAGRSPPRRCRRPRGSAGSARRGSGRCPRRARRSGRSRTSTPRSGSASGAAVAVAVAARPATAARAAPARPASPARGAPAAGPDGRARRRAALGPGGSGSLVGSCRLARARPGSARRAPRCPWSRRRARSSRSARPRRARPGSARRAAPRPARRR